MLKQAWTVLGVMVCTASLGCAGPQPRPTDSPEKAAKAAPAQELAGSSGGKPPVLVITPGQEPRQLLRYVHRKDEEFLVSVRHEMTMAMDGGPSVTIPMLYEATQKNLSVDAGGAARRSGRYAKLELIPGADPRVAQAMTTALKGFERVTFSDRIDSQGNVSNVSVDVSAIENERLRTMVAGMQDAITDCAMPWPLEPVGIGARWRRTRQVKANGVAMEQTAVMSLVERQGNQVDTTIEISQHADPQMLALPDGTSAELVSLKGSGKGTWHTVLDPLSFESKSTVIVETTMRQNQTESTTTLTMQIALTMRSTGK